ncbi:MAG: hypothetical protein V8S24_12385 [Gordonibacter pamelaeae]
MRTVSASKADIWVPVRPGTDCALAMAILNVIIQKICTTMTSSRTGATGSTSWPSIMTQYTPEWASPITGVPVEQIYEIARMMGTMKPMAINFGNGIGDQQNDGHWASRLYLPYRGHHR